MAIRSVYIKGGNGFPISYEVDSSTDHSGLPNSVFFKQVDLDSLVRYKDASGNILDAFSSGGTGDMTKAVYDTDNDGVVDYAEKLPIEVINKTGATLTKGTIVYLNTTSSSTNYPEAIKANATSSATSDKTLGAVYADIAINATGYVIVAGQVHNLDTSMYNVGDRLWLSTTDGLVTTTMPVQPNHTVFIGHVTRSQSVNGRILYAIQNGYHLEDLHNVSRSVATASNNDFLYYDSVGGLWKNKAITGADVTQSSTYRFVSDTEKTTWNNKEGAISAGTTLQYWRGDKSWQTLDKSAIGLGNVDNTSDVNKPVSTATTAAINTATSNTSILSKILTGLNITGGAITSTNTILEAFGQVQNQINTLFGQDITTVANYSALPAANTVSGKFYWCQASQGTAWLPGSLGGTYYNAGLYHSNGTTWEWQQYAYQATQAEVNAGLVTDKFVSPSTLASSTQWGASITGVAILNFGNEEDAAVVTVANVDITPSNFRLITFVPQETTETSLDDFKLNGVDFNIENIISNTSFNIRGTAVNNASGNYTVNYYITRS